VEVNIAKNSYKKNHGTPPSKKKKRGKNLSPRNRKAWHSIGTALYCLLPYSISK
jgi:hypothetical protein